ncbi:unnamed protein product [Arabis nemorensis]|uniref:DNA-directed DNA polymerase n=1 Tax=Arabis nemorensis TaxID=586526 RepID=A0A565BJE5_9BRAS|nr:unnamed protein product [Arabis nemorensis]
MENIGSSHGWIATLKDDGIVRLHNDLNLLASDSNHPKCIALPPLVTLPRSQTRIVTNVAMSSSSPEDEDCVVAIKFLGNQLSFCRPAQTNPEWFNIKIENPCYFSSPVMFSKKDDMFRIPGSGGLIIGSWDPRTFHHKPKVQRLRFPCFPIVSRTGSKLMDSCLRIEHLVESRSTGEIFLVKWYKKTLKINNRVQTTTQDIMVFNVDEKGNAVYTKDIGDLCIFLSNSEAFCVPASSFPRMSSNEVHLFDADEATVLTLADAALYNFDTEKNLRGKYGAPYHIPPFTNVDVDLKGEGKTKPLIDRKSEDKVTISKAEKCTEPSKVRENLRKLYDKVLIVDNVPAAKNVVAKLLTQYRNLVHSCDAEVSGIEVKDELICFSIYCGSEADFGNGKSCIWVDVLGENGREVLSVFKPYFEDSSIRKLGWLSSFQVWHNYSFDSQIIRNHGIDISGFQADTMHMAQLWDSARRTEGGYSLDALTSDPKVVGATQTKEFLGKFSMKTIFGKKKDGSQGKIIVIPPVEELQREDREAWISYSALGAISTLKLYESMTKKLELKEWRLDGKPIMARTMLDFYHEYWRPFGELLVKMEAQGILVDREYLAGIQKVAKAEHDDDYIDSLISNFILPLQGSNVSGKDGRVHCSLNINAETGRLSATRPNLQHQHALGKDRYKIRKAFVAAPGNSLIVADYEQLELRILAHLAGCKSMMEAFKSGGDFHSRTAMNMYPHIREAVEKGQVLLEWHPQPGEDKPPVPLLKDAFASERRQAKMLNFSIAYGKTAIGLSRHWKISREEAQDPVNLWYNDRQEVRKWQEFCKKEAMKDGYVLTLLGRARRFPAYQSRAHRNHIQRAAINTPVQGSAADVAMCAMLEISTNQRLKELGWKLLLQIHNEVILEGPMESEKIAKDIVVECMSKPFNGRNILSVDLSVDVKCAQNWYAAKKMSV